ncbi:hypothetical protein PENSPDRAFT_185865 [Peniophora sp. CONT]|nr:hypothetical protein PENSPDRAFT_185865 [Peniophora sp. CONT]
MQSYMVNLSDSNAIISGTLDPTSCKIKPGSTNGDDAGFYIEGLSIVADKTANQTYTQMLNQLVPAIVSFPGWHNNSGGILIEGAHPTEIALTTHKHPLSSDLPFCSKGILIRGLLEARLRNPSNTGLIALIDSYLTIQFNAVRKKAYLKSNQYASSWFKISSSDEYDTVGQIDALDVLNSASAIAPVTADVAPSQVTRPPATHSSPIGIIIGAAVGGVVTIAAFALVLCIRLRRRRRRAREIPIRDDRSDIQSKSRMAIEEDFELAEPFTLPAPAHDRSSSPPEKGQGGSQQRVPLLRDISDNSLSPSSSPTNPFLDPPTSHWDGSNAQTRPVNGDSDAQEALERSRMLERRLDDLMHSLARRGETESIPPEYDGEVIDRASGQEERDK